jgi:hypothetical protein
MVAPVTKRFKFVSPGILINEIDNSFLPRETDRLGPIIIGRTERGPGMRPVSVKSQSEFVETFGNTIPGKQGGDIWREGNYLAPTYASYAAMAYLKNNGPVTMIRLMGTENTDKLTGGEAGWNITGDAFGLFCVNSSSMGVAPKAIVQVTATNASVAVGDTITLRWRSEDGVTEKTHVLTCHGSDDDDATFAADQGATGAKKIEVAINAGSYLNGGSKHPFSASLDDRDITIHGPTAENILGGCRVQVNYSSVLLRVTASATPGAAATVIGDDAAGFFYGGTDATIHTGTLAAVWYVDSATEAVVLKGDQPGGAGTEVSGTGVWVKSVDDDSFKVQLVSAGNTRSWTKQDEFVFSMNPNAGNFVRNMFNTNPTQLNSSITAGSGNDTKYFLGETFESFYHDRVTTAGSGNQLGIILKLANASTVDQSTHQRETAQSETGWVIAQDTSTNSSAYEPADMQQLFKLVSKYGGAHDSGKYKVSIEGIKTSKSPHGTPYGSFNVVIRETDDDDTTVRVVEKYTSCNLNPASSKYIARVIGDQYETWDSAERRYRLYGGFPTRSDIVYVQMNSDVDAGATDPILLPFGFLGPARHAGFGVISGRGFRQPNAVTFDTLSGSVASTAFAKGNQDTVAYYSTGSGHSGLGVADAGHFAAAADPIAAKFLFPSMQLRTSTEDLKGQGGNGKAAYFGVQTNRSGSNRRDPAWYDLVKNVPSGMTANGASSGQEYSFKFSLDDVKALGTAHAEWNAQNRRLGLSCTALTGTFDGVLDRGFDKFTMPLWGGDDGVDITEKEPFANRVLSGKNEKNSYAYNSVRRAIDIMADPEVVEFNAAALPGITNTGLTTHLVNTCEARADALAIIDIEGGFKPHTENADGDNAAGNRGSVDTTIDKMKDRRLNSNYACCYYPWVRANDPFQDSALWLPPSVVALGTMGSSEIKSELWFAPAGFTRGGLTEGSAGIPVVGVRERLTSKERDKLYDTNINPIATFPAEGIVIFGQKTLQVTPSALDRINVRRLLIYVKKEVSRMAATTLFEQNVPRTWNRFLGKVNPFLRSVQARLGLMDFKVVLDETTTTPDLIDRNIMYAKIFLKPAKAIEFIAIDFVITDSGASFED